MSPPPATVAALRIPARLNRRAGRRRAAMPVPNSAVLEVDSCRRRPGRHAVSPRSAMAAVTRVVRQVVGSQGRAGSAVSRQPARAVVTRAERRGRDGRAVASHVAGQAEWGPARRSRSVEWARPGRPTGSTVAGPRASTVSGRGGQGVGPTRPSAGWAGGRGRPGSTPRWGRVDRWARGVAIARRAVRAHRNRSGRRIHCSRRSPTDRSRSGRNPSGRRPPRWRCRGRCRPRDASAGRRPGSAGWPRGGSRTGTAPTGRCRCPPRRAAGCARPTSRRP